MKLGTRRHAGLLGLVDHGPAVVDADHAARGRDTCGQRAHVVAVPAADVQEPPPGGGVQQVVAPRLLRGHHAGQSLEIRAEVLILGVRVDVAEATRDARVAVAHRDHVQETTRRSTTGQRRAEMA
jgi:hypothetical protein